jgi:hypothetical protein
MPKVAAAIFTRFALRHSFATWDLFGEPQQAGLNSSWSISKPMTKRFTSADLSRLVGG